MQRGYRKRLVTVMRSLRQLNIPGLRTELWFSPYSPVTNACPLLVTAFDKRSTFSKFWSHSIIGSVSLEDSTWVWETSPVPLPKRFVFQKVRAVPVNLRLCRLSCRYSFFREILPSQGISSWPWPDPWKCRHRMTINEKECGEEGIRR